MGVCRSKQNQNNEEKSNNCIESISESKNVFIDIEQKEDNYNENEIETEMIGELSRYISELKYEIQMLKKNQKLSEIKNISKFENIEKNLNIYKKTEELVNNFKKKENLNNNKISRKIIDKYVSRLIEDENVNIDFLPDFIEKKIYNNIFTLILGILDNILDTVEIRFLDHKIEFDLIPEY